MLSPSRSSPSAATVPRRGAKTCVRRLRAQCTKRLHKCKHVDGGAGGIEASWFQVHHNGSRETAGSTQARTDAELSGSHQARKVYVYPIYIFEYVCIYYTAASITDRQVCVVLLTPNEVWESGTVAMLQWPGDATALLCPQVEGPVPDTMSQYSQGAPNKKHSLQRGPRFATVPVWHAVPVVEAGGAGRDGARPEALGVCGFKSCENMLGGLSGWARRAGESTFKIMFSACGPRPVYI